MERLSFPLVLLLVSIAAVQGKYQLAELDIDESQPYVVYTAEDLKKYDGSDESRPILMVVRGFVFDVTKGKSFYGKGAPYNALVGKDASRAVAKMSLEPDDLNNNLEGLTDEQLQSLDRVFSGTYKAKYPLKGYMDYFVAEVQNRNKKSEL